MGRSKAETILTKEESRGTRYSTHIVPSCNRGDQDSVTFVEKTGA